MGCLQNCLRRRHQTPASTPSRLLTAGRLCAWVAGALSEVNGARALHGDIPQATREVRTAAALQRCWPCLACSARCPMPHQCCSSAGLAWLALLCRSGVVPCAPRPRLGLPLGWLPCASWCCRACPPGSCHIDPSHQPTSGCASPPPPIPSLPPQLLCSPPWPASAAASSTCWWPPTSQLVAWTSPGWSSWCRWVQAGCRWVQGGCRGP